MKQLQPCGSRLILSRIEAEPVTKGGIHLPDTAKDKTKLGTVLASGDRGPSFEVGDIVVFGQYTGEEVTLDEDTFLIVAKKDVLAVVRDEHALDFKADGLKTTTTRTITAEFKPEYASEEERLRVMRAIAKKNTKALTGQA